MAEASIWAPSGVWDIDPERQVIALHSDREKSLSFVGPVPLTEENGEMLDAWAQQRLDVWGGYVFLIVVDGEAAVEELRQEVAEEVAG